MSTFARTDTSVLGRWWWTVDRWMLGMVALLAVGGVLLTAAASPAVADRIGLDAFYFARRQFVYLPLALAMMLLASLFSPKGVLRVAAVVFVPALVLTVATLFTGMEIKGATRWVRIAGTSVQPSEFLKPAFAVISAWLLTHGRLRNSTARYPLAVGLLLLVGGTLLLQPDVGTTLLLASVWTVQVFLAGLPATLVVALGLLFAGGGVAAYFSFDHVRNRIDHFLDPSIGEGFQVNRALDAFRSGGWFGRGPGEGRVKEVLPDAHADFIFAVAGEEFGIVVCLIVVGLFAFIVLRGFARAFKDDNLFVIVSAGGLVALFGLQALMNMASTLHLIPPKGITLPFVSYGGSATLALAWTVGMLLALTRDRRGKAGAE